MNDIVYWCAEECEANNLPALSVAHVYSAWSLAKLFHKMDNHHVSLGVIVSLNKRVCPDEFGHFRTGLFTQDCGLSQIKPEDISNELEKLCKVNLSRDPKKFYDRFIKLAPFKNGNRVVGSLLFNWDCLGSPIHI